jgi:hypothetical protein
MTVTNTDCAQHPLVSKCRVYQTDATCAVLLLSLLFPARRHISPSQLSTLSPVAE